ncbi:undecaprenyl-diphosphate phosphatase [Paludibacterium paludis]|uniref:Undecaprenyl-diphosphatase n=1 Tax=Paludibacterium paludis TaxID=1225769 RepID=A0A918P193_9NEIS|nr:undecaprenyl-diphosphate phosphatase [Paludibacterium paludis]GGY12069.1 undecaprenyl-diphosphatase 2 [Paludibacterium paludis]
MDVMYLFKALLLGIVEGMTEFLPVSSTGHLILFGDWLSFDSGSDKVFEVVIQLGSILAVCWLYREKILRVLGGLMSGDAGARRFSLAVILAFFPSVVVGLAFGSKIKALFFNPTSVAIALIVGGLVILAVEARPRAPRVNDTERIGWRQALGIGAAQCLAMIPGTSRSGATIIGGMIGGLSRQTATEFSFFLAIPTMFGATFYDLLKHHDKIDASQMGGIAVGFVVAFLSALLVVKLLVRFIARHTFRGFAWYRIALGAAILLLR